MTRLAAALAALALIAVACTSGGSGDTTGTTTAPASTTTRPGSTSTAPPTTSPPTTGGVATSNDLPGDLPLVTGAWNTDWTLTTIDLSELQIGIFQSDPRDRIAPIDEPKFEGIAAAADWLSDREPGLLLEFEGGARFYPLQILTLHEVVNDEAAGIPIAVTYCPLCNTGVVFDRRIDGVTHRFGVSGLLRKSDLVMWDDQTESLWQQITGEAIVGSFAGTNLTQLPASLVGFGEYRASFPAGEVLSRDTGFPFPYGINPYELYSSRTGPFGFFDGEVDDRYAALERVIGVNVGDAAKGFPFTELAEVGVANDEIGGTPIVVMWAATDTADALDTETIADAQAIGTGVAYERTVEGEVLTFTADDDATYTDTETGSTWTILGEAIAGPLAGSRLSAAVHRNEFWFAWTAFFPEAAVFTAA